MNRPSTLVLIPLAVAFAGCGNEDQKPKADAASATASATSTASGVPSATAPKTPPRKPYAGPTGAVVGKVTITGDPSPETTFKYEKGCEGAIATYGKLFRTGPDGGLADAMVAVTDYGEKKYIPPKQEAVPITITNCAFSQRTVVMTNGQHLTVQNLMNAKQFLPHLDGARQPATVVAVPGGEPIKVFSRGISRYWLRDQMGRQQMVAHVFHLPYATATVTDLNGTFRLEGIPAGGTVKVSAMLPQLKNMNATTKELKVEAGKDNEINLELTFDAAKDIPADGHGGTKPGAAPVPSSAPSGSPSAAPSATAKP